MEIEELERGTDIQLKGNIRSRKVMVLAPPVNAVLTRETCPVGEVIVSWHHDDLYSAEIAVSDTYMLLLRAFPKYRFPSQQMTLRKIQKGSRFVYERQYERGKWQSTRKLGK